MRLQKYLASAGIASRRKSEELIRNGKALVNGARVPIAHTIDPDKDIVTVNGKRIHASPLFYIALNKPKGYLSTVCDPQGRPTIMDLVQLRERVYPVGRLDKDSEGLMLLTNDGELAYALTHPKFKVEKVYEVVVQGVPSEEKIRKLKKGIPLQDGLTAPCDARIMKTFEGKKKCRLEIKLHEGRKREIRRMMEFLLHPVLTLRRIAIGALKLSTLSPGKFRSLSESEIKLLKKHQDRANPC